MELHGDLLTHDSFVGGNLLTSTSRVSVLMHKRPVANWLERTTCSTESIGSSLAQDCYYVGTLSMTLTYDLDLCRDLE